VSDPRSASQGCRLRVQAGAPTGRARSLRRVSLTGLLLLLIGVITIPLTVLSGSVIYLQYCDNREKAETSLVQHARTIAELVDREFERAQAMAQASAASDALRRGDLGAFRDELIEVSRTYGEGLPRGAQPVMIGLAGLDGNWIADTGPLGTFTEKHRAPDHAQQAIASGLPQISDIYIGSITQQPRVSVSVPVFSTAPGEDGVHHVIGAIGVAISRQRFLDIVAQTRLPPGALASIQDRRGLTLARSYRDAETAGKFLAPVVLRTIMGGDSGIAPAGTKTLEGVPSTVAFAHAPNSGFIVKLEVPEGVFLAPLLASLTYATSVAATILAVGLGLAFLLARHMVLALRRVVPAAQEAASSGVLPVRLGLQDADGLAGELTRLLVEQQSSARALAESERKFRTLADVMPHLVWAADPDGYCDYFNARCYAFTGRSEGSLDGQIWKNLTHPDDRAILDAAWHAAIEAGNAFEVECRHRRHDGEYRWMLVRAVPMRAEPDAQDSRGRVVRWFGSSTDITDIVEARNVSARSRSQLEALVETRTAELNIVQASLAHAARMEALGQLAGGIAHDFNNVLQAILGGSALIERKPEEAVNVRRYARMIFDSAERGSVITQRLLDFSRRSALRTEVIDPAAILGDLQEILTHTLGAGIKTEIHMSPGLPPLLADKGQLETVLVNLATNARDAMDGRGVIVLAAALDHVEAATTRRQAALSIGSYICLSVSDNGTGMDAAILERVFEPFFTTKKPGQGTGLGLAMAHGFAGQSGGALHIESTPGMGTTVRLWLPTADPVTRLQTDDAASGLSPTHHHARLLLVDDEAQIRGLVGDALRAEGFTVIVAASAEEALTILQGADVDLLIADLSMPGTDGVAVIEEAQRRKPGLPAILATGFASDVTDVAMKGAFSGSFSLIRKPIPPSQLAQRVRELLPVV
jgi:PAS domain S-box-containing protein